MRWNYLLPRLVLGALVWVFFAFGFDPLLHRGATATGEYALAARIEVDGFHSAFFPPKADVGHVAIANRNKPGTNLVEFDSLHVELAGSPLLHKNYIIENATVSGLQFGTPRSDSGVLDRKPLIDFGAPDLRINLDIGLSNQSRQWLDQALNLAKGELDPRQLETVQLAEDLKAQWNKRFDDLTARAKAIEARAKSIDAGTEAKGNALDKMQAYRQTAADANKLLADVEQIRTELKQLPQIANRDLRALDEARQRDLERIRKKTELLTLDPQKLSEALLGKQLTERIQQAIAGIAYVKKGLDSVIETPEPERLRGIDVVFQQSPPLPRFLIRNLNFDGKTTFADEPLAISGTVTGITSDPAIHGEPTVVHATCSGQSSMEINAVVDQTHGEPSYGLAVVYRNPQRLESKLGDGGSMAFIVSAATTECRARLQLVKDQVAGDIQLVQSPVRITLDRANPTAVSQNESGFQWEDAIQSTLDGIQNLNATLVISGRTDHPEWKLTSNLGQQLAGSLNSVLTRQIEQQQAKLAARIDAATQEQTMTFRKLLTDRHGQIVAQLNADDDIAKKAVARLTGGKSLNLNQLLR